MSEGKGMPSFPFPVPFVLLPESLLSSRSVSSIFEGERRGHGKLP